MFLFTEQVNTQHNMTEEDWRPGAMSPSAALSHHIIRVMADSIPCSCVTCPKCGIWVVVKEPSEPGMGKERFRANCPAPECGKEFEFGADETRVFEVPLPLFERRHFYRSELR